jgi:hypothetical protein
MTYKAGLFTISVAIILFTSVGASSAAFVSADSDLDQTEIQEFSSGTIVATSSTTLTKAIEFMDNILVELSSESKVGPAVSQAAQLHKLFAHEDKSIKKEFQKAFLDFIKQVKGIVGVGNGAADKSTFNELYKSGHKVEIQSVKDDKIQKTKIKMQGAIDLSNLKKALRNSINEYVIIDTTMKDGPDKDVILSDLKGKNIKLMKEKMFAESKHNGKALTVDDIKKINQKATENIENPKGQKTDTSDNGDDGNGSDKGNNGKSNNGKSSDKGNKSKSNNGKSKK